MKNIDNLILILTTVLFINIFSTALADVNLSLKINDTIITNYDIQKEAKYLKALNNKLSNLENKQILKIAKETITKETIKKIELEKYYNLDQKNPQLDEIIKDVYLTLELKNEIEFINHLKKYDHTIDEVKKKLEIESTWNNLIVFKYKKQIKINEKQLEEKISDLKNGPQKKTYLLSEIVLTKKNNAENKILIKKIEESILEIGFDNTANIYSISDSSKFGGKIGWVEENNLSLKLKSEISKLKVNDYSKPIFINNNFLILKVNDIKIDTVELNKKLMLSKMVAFETNKQLAIFSKIYYNQIKMNTEINEF